jgi:hypothetical protein
MIRLVAEIKPLDILGPIVALAIGAAIVGLGLGMVGRFLYLLVQPFYAIATSGAIEEDSKFAWAALVVAGLVYWQLS